VGIFGMKIQRHFSGWAHGLQSVGLNQHIFMLVKIIKIIVLKGFVSFLFCLAANT